MKRILSVCVLAVVSVSLTGCDVFAPKVPSPISGRELTGPELIAEAQAEEAKKAREELKERAEAEARLRKVAAEAEAQLANLEAAGKIEEAQRQAEAAQVVRDARAQSADVQARLVATVTRLTAEREAIADGVELALTEIQRKADQQSSVLAAVQSVPVVGSALASVGLNGETIAVLAGALGIGGAYNVAGKRAAKRTKAEAEEARRREHELWDEAEAKAEARANATLRDILLAKYDANKDGRLDAAERSAAEAGIGKAA